MNFEEFCSKKNCEHYHEWIYEVYDDYGEEIGYPCFSCDKIGQSYHIDTYPEDCLYLNEIKELEKVQSETNI